MSFTKAFPQPEPIEQPSSLFLKRPSAVSAMSVQGSQTNVPSTGVAQKPPPKGMKALAPTRYTGAKKMRRTKKGRDAIRHAVAHIRSGFQNSDERMMVPKHKPFPGRAK